MINQHVCLEYTLMALNYLQASALFDTCLILKAGTTAFLIFHPFFFHSRNSIIVCFSGLLTTLSDPFELSLISNRMNLKIVSRLKSSLSLSRFLNSSQGYLLQQPVVGWFYFCFLFSQTL